MATESDPVVYLDQVLVSLVHLLVACLALDTINTIQIEYLIVQQLNTIEPVSVKLLPMSVEGKVDELLVNALLLPSRELAPFDLAPHYSASFLALLFYCLEIKEERGKGIEK